MFAYIMLMVSLLTASPLFPDVILITLDGVRWQEVFQGTDPQRDGGHHLTPQRLLPNLYNYFVEQGVAVGRDTPIIASGPRFVSLPGYMEITRGHPSTDCQTNSCNPVIDQSVFDLFNYPAVFSSWSQIKKTVPVGDNIYSDTGKGHYRLDRDTQLAVKTYLDRHTPDFLWVALGDTDELAHQNNYIKYITALRQADDFIGYLVNRFPNTTIIVATDHGRSLNFKDHDRDTASQRVWLMMRGLIPNQSLITDKVLRLSNIYYIIQETIFNIHNSNLENSLIWE